MRKKNIGILKKDGKRSKSSAYVRAGVSYCNFCGKAVATDDLKQLKKKGERINALDKKVKIKGYYLVCKGCYKGGKQPTRIN